MKTDILKVLANGISKNSHSILMALGVAGFGGTVYLSVRATPSAKAIHDKHVWDRADISELEKDPKTCRKLLTGDICEEVKELAPICLPAAGMGLVTLACFFGASKVQADKQAALVAAYSLSEKTLATYQEKVIEKLGQDAHEDILKETTREIVRNEAPSDLDPERVVNPEGLVRCYDNVTGRYFFSTKERILEAESSINKRLLNETVVPLQEFYYELGLEERFTLGEAMGWDISSPYFAGDNVLNIWFTPMLDDDKNPCLALNYHVLIFERSA